MKGLRKSSSIANRRARTTWRPATKRTPPWSPSGTEHFEIIKHGKKGLSLKEWDRIRHILEPILGMGATPRKIRDYFLEQLRMAKSLSNSTTASTQSVTSSVKLESVSTPSRSSLEPSKANEAAAQAEASHAQSPAASPTLGLTAYAQPFASSIHTSALQSEQTIVKLEHHPRSVILPLAVDASVMPCEPGPMPGGVIGSHPSPSAFSNSDVPGPQSSHSGHKSNMLSGTQAFPTRKYGRQENCVCLSVPDLEVIHAHTRDIITRRYPAESQPTEQLQLLLKAEILLRDLYGAQSDYCHHMSQFMRFSLEFHQQDRQQ